MKKYFTIFYFILIFLTLLMGIFVPEIGIENPFVILLILVLSAYIGTRIISITIDILKESIEERQL